MKVRILACGVDGAGKDTLLRTMVTGEFEITVPETKLGVTYVTETADYLSCPFLPEDCDDFFGEVNKNFRIRFDATDPETCDVVWYCLPADKYRKIPTFLRKFPGRMVIVLTRSDCVTPQDIQQSISELTALKISRTKIVPVSNTTRAGLVQLVRATAGMLRVKGETDERVDDSISYRDKDRIVLPEHPDADSFIHWAAGRAFAIAAVPLPLADIAPLFANEAYMIHQLGKLYGYSIDQTLASNFIGCVGASLGGKLLTSFVPFLKASVAAAITYGLGKAAKAYFESGMTLDNEKLGEIFQQERNVAKDIEW